MYQIYISLCHILDVDIEVQFCDMKIQFRNHKF
jgi:hypothetical protein